MKLPAEKVVHALGIAGTRHAECRLERLDARKGDLMTAGAYRYAVHRHEAGGDAMALASLTSTFNSSGRNVKMLLSALTQAEAFLYRLNVQ